MQHATSEPVRLKASTEILDRAGVRGGIELDAMVSTGERSATEIIAERLDRLRAGAVVIAGEIVDRAISTTPNDVTEAEVVSDDDNTA